MGKHAKLFKMLLVIEWNTNVEYIEIDLIYDSLDPHLFTTITLLPHRSTWTVTLITAV